jgi:hypothetical protein
VTGADMRRLLEQLGPSPAEVAATLARLGHKGIRLHGCDCPVANYLRANGVGEPEVDACWVYDWTGPSRYDADGDYDKEGSDNVVRPPNPVADFIEAFDKGQFSELVEQVPA